MARPFRGDHEHIHILRRLDEPEVNAEPMCQRQVFSGLQHRRDIGVVDSRRQLVRSQDHDDVGGLRGLTHGHDPQSGLLRLGDRSAGWLEADDDVAARVRQIHGVGMALRTEADDGNFLVLDVVKIRVLIVINLHSSSCCVADVSNFDSERKTFVLVAHAPRLEEKLRTSSLGTRSCG